MPHYFDVTAPLSEAMPVWPGTKAVAIEQCSDMELGHIANSQHLSFPNHIGTHMDAPLHFIRQGKSIDEVPLDVVCGKAKVVFIDTASAITAEQLQAVDLTGVERLLLRTQNSENVWWTQPFLEEFAYLSTEAARYLATTAIRLIGIDYLSVAGYNKNEEAVHKAILGSGIWIVEGLKLAGISPGNYQFHCLPLKLSKGDGAPCRAILSLE